MVALQVLRQHCADGGAGCRGTRNREMASAALQVPRQHCAGGRGRLSRHTKERDGMGCTPAPPTALRRWAGGERAETVFTSSKAWLSVLCGSVDSNAQKAKKMSDKARQRSHLVHCRGWEPSRLSAHAKTNTQSLACTARRWHLHCTTTRSQAGCHGKTTRRARQGRAK